MDMIHSHIEYRIDEPRTMSENRGDLLRACQVVEEFLNKYPLLREGVSSLEANEEYVLLTLIAAGQGQQLFYGWKCYDFSLESLKTFARQLIEIDRFYEPIGGLIGYHALFIQLLDERQETIEEGFAYSNPQGMDLTHDTDEKRTLTVEALRCLEKTALILPIGGAGDRLMLRNPQTGEPLPSACLRFSGCNLLEGMMRDWQAQEYLHFKLYGKQVQSPIVMMTSIEKNNHCNIQDICEANGWFSRPREKFFFVVQPSVPMMTEEGSWVFSGPLKLLLKPSGHGVLWTLMETQGVFDRLKEAGIQKGIVRQINNPLAATDDGLLAFAGKGWKGDSLFGFASSKRGVNVPAGVLVLKEKEIAEGYQRILTNIEYTDFKRYGIEDVPESPGSSYSKYALNTNILFADLQAVRQAALKRPFPGVLINIKNDSMGMDSDGNLASVRAGRIETTMQNIADEFLFTSPSKGEATELPVYATYHELRKLFSAVKKPYSAGQSSEGTPEQAFFDAQLNAGDLLRTYCGFDIPEFGTWQDYVADKDPGYHIRFHPSLGPCYSIIAQKIQGGSLAKGSELVLDIAELEMQQVNLKGSLTVISEDPMGLGNAQKGYSHQGGKCELKEVQIVNAGVDFAAAHPLWSGDIPQKESLEIILHGCGEFFAEHVQFIGPHRFEVPSGVRMTVTDDNGSLHITTERIVKPSWYWDYNLSKENRFVLKKCVL